MTVVRWVALFLAAFALVPPASRGIDGALDDVPAGLLLLPYFEVDLDDPNGPDTVFSLHNNSAGPILSDVVLFTDWGLLTLNFTVFLGPFAVQEIRMRDVFNGLFPNIEATPGCPTLGPISPSKIAGAVAAHRGVATTLFDDECAGQNLGDGLLRGFGLAFFPSFCSAFAGSAAPGVLQGFNPEESNLLWGDYTLIEREAGVAAGELLPALEFGPSATAVTSGVSGPPIGFFLSAAERLPQVWGVPISMLEGTTTEVIVVNLPATSLQSAPCGSTPSWYPQGQAELQAFDEDGASVSLDSFRPFPAVTNRVTAGPVGFPVPFDQGWLRADLLNDPLFLQNGGGAGGQSGEPFNFSYVAVLQRDDGLATLRRAIALPTPSEQ